MIIGTGLDITAIARFERFVSEQNEALFRRVFTDSERAYCEPKQKKAQHYALRFAAKEAFLKALGTGLREGMSWKEMEVRNDRLGKPLLILTGRAAELASERGVAACHLSLSHDGGVAVAMVVLEGT